MSKKCKHQNIIITTKTRYFIKQGWDKLMEQENVDLEEYRVENADESVVFCEDCGEYLEDYIL